MCPRPTLEVVELVPVGSCPALVAFVRTFSALRLSVFVFDLS